MANESRINAAVETIKAQRIASRLCSEMAAETTDNAESATRFANDGAAIDDAYSCALDSIDRGNWSEGVAELERAQAIEKDGGDDRFARKSLEALQGLLSDSTAT